MKVPQWNTAIPQGFLRSITALFIFLLFAGYLFAQDPTPRDPEPQNSSEQQEPENDDPLARQKYIEELRGSDSGIPPGARANALREMDELIRQEGETYRRAHNYDSGAARREVDPSIAGSLPTSSQWLFIGPQPTTTTFSSGNSSGRVTAAVVDPNDATGNTVYVGAAQGGVWKTTNGGVNWTALTDSQPSLAIGSLAIDASTNPSTIYAGTGEPGLAFDSYYGAGVLKSSDGGATWTQLGTNLFGGPLSGCITSGNACGGAFIGGLSVRPGGANPATLIAAVNLPFGQGGIYRTTDGGVTWSQVVTVASGFSVDYATNLIAYAGVDANGIYKSTDGGATWNPANGTGANLLTTSGTGRIEFAIAKSDATGNTVYAAVGNPSSTGGALSGFYRTVDGGTNWTKLGPAASPSLSDFCTPQCWYDMTVAVNPTNANIVFVGGSAVASAVSKSTTGGASWVTATTGLHVDHHASAFSADGTKLYWGTDGGMYKTTDTGTGSTVAWTNINATLGITQFYSYFALHPSNINISFGGAQDNGTQKYDGTQALSTAWSNVTCGDGGGAVIDAFSSTNVFANCQNVDVRKSTTSGSSFASSISGLTTSDRVTFIAPLVGDNNASALNNLYFGTFRVYQSKNSASTWSAISGDLTGGSSTISNMAVAPGDVNTMYVATRDGRVWKGTGLTTTNCASTLACFTNVTGTGLIAARRINAVAISPTDSNLVYVGQSGFSSPSTQHVSMSSTGGNTWTDISSNLPNAPVNDLVVDPDIAGTLYAATDIGVFRSQDNGASWTTLANGLPRIAVYGLKLHKASRTLRAATHGRGFWDLSVPVGAPAAAIGLSTASLTFASQGTGTTSVGQTVTLTATNGAINGISVSAASGDFSQTNNCAATLAQNSTCTVTATFSPTVAGVRTGTITVTSSGTGSPQTINMTGTGVLPVVGISPGPLTFASQVTNTSSATQVVTLTANNGPISGISISAATGDFSQGNTCSATLAQNSTCTITVTFTPTATGTRTGAITITSSGSGSPQTISLTGTGVLPPALGLTSSSLIFASQNTNTTSASQTVTLTANNGSITSIAVSAATGDFSRTTTCTATLAQNSTCTITVSFTPTAAGTRTGAITITSSGAGSPQTMNLSGAGVLPPALGATPSNSLTYSNQITNTTSASQTLTLTANNGSVAGISISAATGDFAQTNNCTATLPQSNTCTITVTFTPIAAGSRSGAITVTSSGLGSPQTISLSGTGVLPPALGLTSSSLTFTNQITNTTSTSQTVTLTANNGGVSSIAVSAATGDYSQTNNCAATLTQNSTCTITVTFTPTATGTRTGAVTITSSGAGSPQTISLSGTGVLPPALGLTSSSLTYSNQVTNTTSTSQTVTLTANNGSVSSIAISAATGDFSQTNNCAATLAQNSTCTVTVTFTPTATGTRTGAITITSSGAGSPQTTSLSGTGVLPPALGLTSSSLSYSNQITNTTSASQVVTLTANNGSVSSIAVTAATGDFSRTTTCTATLAQNSTCTITVTFTPTATGTRTGAITVTSAGAGSPQTITLSGPGVLAPVLGLTSSSLTYSNQITNTTSASQTVTLTANNGSVGSIAVSAATGDFSQTNDCLATLAQNSTCTITVTFTPTITGTRTGAITVSSTGAGSPQTISLSGTGVLPPALGLTSSSLTFANQITNTTSASQTVTLTANNGGVSSIAVSAATGDYSQTNNCAAPLAQNSTCTITVTFTPTATGTRTGAITITSSGAGSPQTISLSGTGVLPPALGLTSSSLTYSNQITNTTSTSQTVTLTANNGAVSGISIPAATGDFNRTTTCAATLALNSTCTVTVTFTPTATGTRTGAITITSSGAGSPQTINLSGTGVLAPALGLTSSSLTFASQITNTSSASQTVTLTANNGSVSSIAVSAATGDFSQTNNCLATLAQNSTCTITVTFTPTTTGTRTGAITITSSGAGSPQTISLSGTGVLPPALGLTSSSLTFANQNTSTTSAGQSVTVRANNGAVNSITVSAATGDFSQTNNCAATLAQNSTCTITVTFTPTASGTRTGAITISSSGAGSPQTVTFSGTGVVPAAPVLDLSQSSLTYTNQVTNTTSPSQTVTVTASNGSVTGISVGAAAGDFSQTNNCPATLAQNSTCTVTVTFTPTAAGTRTGAITITSSGSGSPQSISLSGTGMLPPSLGLTSSSVTYANQITTTTSVSQTVTLTANNGSVSSIAVSAATGDFSRTTTCAATLAQNSTCAVTVTFTPTATGTRTGAITVTSSGAGSPQTISLSGTGVLPPALGLTSSSVTYANQITNTTSASQTVTLTANNGNVTGISIPAATGDFSQTNDCLTTLAQNSTCTVTVTFTPTAAGTRTGAITVTSSGAGSPQTINLSGTGVLAPALGFTSSSLPFTNQITNTTSASQTVTLTAINGGVNSISVSAATGDFNQTNNCAASLAQNSTCTITVTFTPTATGARTGAITVTSSGAGSPQTINLSGTGVLPPAVGLSQSSLAFATQVTNTTSPSQTMTLTANNGGISGIAVSAATGDFSQTNTCSVTLAQNSTCTITVTFTPTAAGSRTGSITVTSSGAGSPQTINLSGTGVLPAVLGLTSNSLIFASQNTNTTSASQTITLTASNGAVNSIVVSAATGDFNQTNSCAGTLAQSSTCTVTVTFTPTAGGTRTGAITITSSGAGSPQTISLSGTGVVPPALGLTSSSLTFANQITSTTSASQTVTLTANNGGVSSIAVSAATGDYSQTNNCTVTLTQNSTCAVTVTFTPTATGTRTGAITITSSGAGSPQTINLSGTGVLPPALGLTSNSLAYANQVTNTTSTSQTVTLTANNGAVNSIAVSAATGDFSQTNNCLATQAQNSTCTITVTFTPTATGARTGAIAITSSGAGSPQTISLSGTGVLPPALGLTSSSLTFANQNTGTTSAGQTITLTANNGAVSGISIPPATGDFSRTTTCTATLAQNGTCTVTVAFTPTATGTRTGAIAVNSSGAGSPQTVNLSGTGVLAPVLGLTSSSLSYSNQITNTTSASQTVTVTANNGSVSSIAVSAATGDFSQTNNCVATLAQNGTCTVTVTFTPTTIGTRTGVITITSSGAGSPQTISLTGTGALPPALGLSQGSLTFASQVTNTSSASQTMVLTANNGAINSIAISAATGDFIQTNTCAATLAQNSTCSITVIFTPTATGTRTGAITVTSSGAGSPQTISLSGSGVLPPALGVTSSSLIFTNQSTGSTSAGQSITLTANNGAINGISISAATGDFSRTTTCTATLAQNSTCTVTVTFTPTAAGTRTGAVTVTSSGAGSPQTISLSGTGVLPSALGLTSSSLTFTNQVTNTVSASQTVTLTANNGAISGISVSAATGDFSRTTTCTATLAQNSTCTIAVTFTPTAAGTRTGAVTVTSSGSGSPQTISLSGNGVLPAALTFSPISLGFVTQTTNTTSPSQSITVTANNGAVNSIAISAAAGDFSQTNTCSASLPIDTTCTINVTFTPIAAGTRTGSITVTSAGLGSPQTISLSGTGIQPAIGLSAGALIYSNQTVGTASASQAVTLTANNGGISGISISATGDFSQTNTCAATLALNSTCTVTVSFTPTAAGTRTGAIAITSSGAGSPQTVSLTGFGVLPTVGISLSSVVFGSQLVTTTSPAQVVTLTANNGAISGITISAATGDFTRTTTCAATLALNSTCTISITFSPTATGNRAGAITVTSSGSGSPQTISISGTGTVTITLGLSPSSLSFSNQAPSTTSPVQTITLTANGGNISNLVVAAATGDFSRTTTCTSTLTQNSPCTVTVTFTPTLIGARSGALSITSSGSGSPQTVNLSGTGVQPSLGFSTGALTFASQSNNTTSAAQTVTLTANNGAISGISISAATGDFSRTTTCAATLAQNATCTVTTTFTPTAVGTRTGAVTITSSGTGSPQTVSLTGTGVLPATLGLATSSLTFASQALNITSGGQAITLTANNGSISGISISAATGDFGQTNTCPTTLAQNATCTVTATFTPIAIGTRTGAITITSSGSGSPQTINLTGAGQDPLLVLPGPLTFSAVVGRQSSPQNLTFFNLAGSTLNVSNVSVSGQYTQTNNCGTLANNTTCNIGVSFIATAVGASNGVLTITTSLGTRTIALNGTVVDFMLMTGRPGRPSRSLSPSNVIDAGQAARFEVQLTASAPMNEVVALECTGAPRGAVCRVEPSRVVLNTTVPVTVVVQTSPYSSRSARLGGNSTGTPSGNYALHLNARIAGQVRTAELPLQVKAQR